MKRKKQQKRNSVDFDYKKACRDIYVAALILQIVEHVESPQFIVCRCL